MNDAIQDLINGLAGHAALLDSVMKASASDLVFLLMLVVPALYFWPAPARERSLNQRLAAASGAAVCLSLAIAAVAGHLHYAARPFVSDASTRLLIQHGADNTFPSEHALGGFALAGVLLRSRRLLGVIVLAGGVLVGVSRVYVGVHWPSDVAASALIGFACGWTLAALVPRLAPLQNWFATYLPPLLVQRP